MDDTTFCITLFLTIFFIWNTGLIAFFLFQYIKMRNNLLLIDKLSNMILGLGSFFSTSIILYDIILPEIRRHQNR